MGEYAHWRLDIVPEPSSLSLLGAGALAVGGFGIYDLMRRRNRKKALRLENSREMRKAA